MDAQRCLFMTKGWIHKPSPKPTEWDKLDQSLAETYSLTPMQIDAMTLPEIRVLCGKPNYKTYEKIGHMEMKGRLTIEEKLQCMLWSKG